MKNKMYTDKNWLTHEYLILEKSALQIASEIGVAEQTIGAYIKKYKLKSEKLPKCGDQSWLYEHFISQNKSETQIANEIGISRGSVQYFVKKFGFNKGKDERRKARKKCLTNTSLETRGVTHFSQDENVKRKIRNTCRKKYGTSCSLHSDAIRQKMSDRGKIILFESGKSLHGMSKEHRVPYTSAYLWYSRNKDLQEAGVTDFLSNYSKYYTDIENIMKDKLELHLFNKRIVKELPYRPDFKLSDTLFLNVDGLFWHSELRKEKFYHFDMREQIADHGIQLLQFRYDEVMDKTDIVLSIINNKRKESHNRIFARKCIVKEVPSKESRPFLDKYHLMGYKKARSIGLYLDNELMMVLSYKLIDRVLKIERLASKLSTNIVGGFSKAMSFLKQMFKGQFDQIHYWVDLRYGTGEFLIPLGFSAFKTTLGWKWTDGRRTFNRLKCRANMDDRKLTQKEYAKELGWYKIYDAGQKLYVM